MISACALCQDGEYLTWNRWTSNCTNTYVGTFPSPVPAGTRVPHYAYLAIGAGDSFSVNAAQAATGPESTAGSSTTTRRSGGTVLPSPPVPTESGKGKVGAIAGGVVGGVFGLALLAAIGLFLFRRSQPKSNNTNFQDGKPAPLVLDYTGNTAVSQHPSGNAGGGHYSTSSIAGTYPTAPVPPMKLYDPGDPSTFPAPLPASRPPSLVPQVPMYPQV